MPLKKRKCIVPNCDFVHSRGFFNVPEHPERLKAWVEACQLSPPYNRFICWKHFKITDFKKEITSDDLANFTFGQLQKNVVPSCHLPGQDVNPEDDFLRPTVVEMGQNSLEVQEMNQKLEQVNIAINAFYTNPNEIF